jgi:hypothetical protein
MKRIKHLLAAACSISLVLVLSFHCKKEPSSSNLTKTNSSTINFFTPQDESDAKEKVLSVVRAYSKLGNQSRTETPDMPLNEARWVLEASGNYLWNRNLAGRKTEKGRCNRCKAEVIKNCGNSDWSLP